MLLDFYQRTVAIPNELHLLQIKNLGFPMILNQQHQEHRTFNTVTANTTQTTSNKCKIRLSFFKPQLLLHANIINKNICKLVYKKQYLKKWLIIQRGRFLNAFK